MKKLTNVTPALVIKNQNPILVPNAIKSKISKLTHAKISPWARLNFGTNCPEVAGPGSNPGKQKSGKSQLGFFAFRAGGLPGALLAI